MAKTDGSVVARAFSELASELYADYGVTVDTVNFKWLDVDVGGPDEVIETTVSMRWKQDK